MPPPCPHCPNCSWKFHRTKPHVNIGLSGHDDHRKTTPTAALIKALASTGGGAAAKSTMKSTPCRKNTYEV
ncbi:putative protein-synthesizing GTPase [Helianthus annuus]|nr:putative protein-synthesizing GTPase [Helianthus annuus]KAJ0888342.1 putative protein-synthesizing GTPase [Helianthus annuus]